ncbi:MAG: response regulator transcription factor [Bacteroidota bacterium]|nr:response regulator transcription factor [Bacteroidota bacterium]
MIKKIKVLIADDHDVYRDGLKMLLQSDGTIDVVEEARNGLELLEMAPQYSPDVIITDLMMPGKSGVEAIKELFESGYKRIIAISTFESEQLIVDALHAGVSGYIIKNAKRGEIIQAVKEVYSFNKYYCKSTSLRLAGMIDELKVNRATKEKLDLFSEKEKEIIRLICEEKTSEEIASILFMSKRTVDGFRSRILIKMNVRTVAGVALYAIRNHIFLPKPVDSPE